jgi:hydrogenase maturation protease
MNDVALVIGYGNRLRSDDGAGPEVAERLAADGVNVRVCDQLVPEMADALRECAVVVFVDAAATLKPGAVASRRLSASDANEKFEPTHDLGPEALLRLGERLYGAKPRAFLVTVGAASFAFGQTLSAPAATALPEAVALVRRLIAATD